MHGACLAASHPPSRWAACTLSRQQQLLVAAASLGLDTSTWVITRPMNQRLVEELMYSDQIEAMIRKVMADAAFRHYGAAVSAAEVSDVTEAARQSVPRLSGAALAVLGHAEHSQDAAIPPARAGVSRHPSDSSLPSVGRRDSEEDSGGADRRHSSGAVARLVSRRSSRYSQQASDAGAQ